MAENRLPEKHNIATDSSNYSEHVKGDHIQGNKGDTINQDGSFDSSLSNNQASRRNILAHLLNTHILHQYETIQQ